jgi:hypothetical protein
MPCVNTVPGHRCKIDTSLLFINACVARAVGKNEIKTTPAAQKALDAEWKKLVDKGVWNQTRCYEWSDLARAARHRNETIHLGRVFELCTEKGSELEQGDPSRKYKGRSVFQGNQVKDQDWNIAMFQDLGSAPAAMAAIKYATRSA